MKKILLFSFAAVAAASLASCSNDDMPEGISPDGPTMIQVRLPENLATRAGGPTYGSGTLATKLYVAIYEQGSSEVLFSNFAGSDKTDGLTVTDFTNLTATVRVNLVKGKAYDLVFWAQSPETTAYTFYPTDKSISVDYAQMANYAENRDAFFNHKLNFVSGTAVEPIELNRPFAQLNIGTSDYAAYTKAGGTAKTFGMKVSGVGNVLDLATGAVTSATGFNGDITVAPAAPAPNIDGVEAAFPVDGYQYLDMAYILAGGSDASSKQNVDVTLTLDGNDWVTSYNNVPLQMNYRTNIYGALLTNPEEFQVTINPAFETPDNNVAVWDGTTVTKPVIDEATKTVKVNMPSDFAGFAQMVSGTGGETANNFAGYTINITNDLDFGGHETPMVGEGATRAGATGLGKQFKGVLDGGNHTFKNVVITDKGDKTSAAVGFVTNLTGEGAEVRNINFENLQLTATASEQLGVVAMVSEGAKVSNVNVLSGSIKGQQGVGAIVGRMMASGTVENCSNAANVTNATYNTGGIVGAAYYTRAGKEMHITGCTNKGVISGGGVATGGIVGLSAAFIDGCSNYGIVTGTQNSVAGIAGTQRNAGGITDCHNYADITGKPNGKNQALGVGGISGWITYADPSSYPNRNVISIENCTNSGNITAESTSASTSHSYAAGGIVGLWYGMGKVAGCTNTATSITADQMIAGIVGSSQWIADTSAYPQGAEEMLYVTGNKSTTTLDQLHGALKALIVYINNADKVTMSGNTPDTNQ